MAFADPQSVKINGAATSLPRVASGNYSSEYLSADGTVKLKISTQNGKRRRQVFRVDWTKFTTDPFDSGANIEVSSSIYLVVDRELVGFTNEELKKTVEGLFEALTASSSAGLIKFLASEN